MSLFIGPLDIPLTNITRLPGDAANPAAASEAFETRVVEAGESISQSSGSARIAISNSTNRRPTRTPRHDS
jgi:hypothetical protein